ncbi:Aryl hydrocarbon receptor [Bagarius yarrelli]|uniref:Aryl hydrocarbon receptor n=1 Tax=Bagarius yarrelli TaxID=175774 RepID=A0A556U4I3_BAGYA|nr:Aryl hydrocarbon receptor [Bagarius yarrelli]
MVTVATKSNPSKRHRDRLNGELDRLTNMLPFPENVLTRLDKLSVLRLSVGYLKVKSFFNATMKKHGVEFHPGNGLDTSKINDVGFSEGELLLQALNGFVLVVSAEGYVFYASSTIHDYLGFHQSDVLHQSVFEFVHVDDRAMFRRQLHFALNPNLSDGEAEGTLNSTEIMRNMSYASHHVPPENSSFLERSFVCRFRCLLDNSSGFLKLNFQGRLKFLLGQNRKTEDGSLVQPQLALFAIATPVQPSAILEIRMKTLIFQTKHKLDFTPLGIDSRNAEGEEHLHQRRLQLPFSFTTGEAVLYDTSSTLDMTSTNASNEVNQKLSVPSSIRLSMQMQDKSIHQQNIEPQFSPDDAFTDSWALFNVPNCPAQVKSTSGENTDESVIDALEQLAQGRDLYTALQQMDTAELNEWETAILRLTKDNNVNDRFLSLDEILTNDIFSYIEDALNKENYTAMDFHSTGAENSELKADRKLIGYLDRTVNTDATMGNNISWYTALSSQNSVNNSPVLEQTSLFTCASKVTQNSVAPRNEWRPENGNKSKLEGTESCCQFASYSASNANDPQMNPSPNHFHNSTHNVWDHRSTGNQNPSMVPSTKTCVPSPMNLPNLSKFPQRDKIQAWQNTSAEQPCASLVKNRLASEGCYQAPAISSNLLPENFQSCNDKHVNFIKSMYQSPGNEFAVNELSSCIFENRTPLNISADQQHPQAHIVAISLCGKSTLPINQSPPQASCYFQWTCSESLVGTSSIPQEDTGISPPSCQTGPGLIAPHDGHSVLQRYLGCNGHI